ncbi:hypothetical protein E4T56_gene6502 [Termitomyces sp. T112]|nr:hypothetical protein E4T56_gene6502 [Termitomyces sp. T112]
MKNSTTASKTPSGVSRKYASEVPIRTSTKEDLGEISRLREAVILPIWCAEGNTLLPEGDTELSFKVH